VLSGGGAPLEELPGELPDELRERNLTTTAPERPAQLLPQDDAKDDLGERLAPAGAAAAAAAAAAVAAATTVRRQGRTLAPAASLRLLAERF
jgi:hypothetical protein